MLIEPFNAEMGKILQNNPSFDKATLSAIEMVVSKVVNTLIENNKKITESINQISKKVAR